MTHEFPEQSALDAMLDAAACERRDNHLAVRRRCAVSLVLSAPGRDVEAAALLLSEPGRQVRFSGPGEWLVQSEDHTSEALADELRARLGDFAFVIDQSHGRVAMGLSGPDARRILANGVGMDLDAAAFPTGRSANALCGHIAINIAATGADEFELLVMRSFAEALVEDIRAMARCHPFSAGFAD